MNLELDTFLSVTRNILAERNTELAELRRMSNREILEFGADEYNAVINAKLDFVGVFTDFVVMCAILLNEGKSVGEVLGELMRRSDDTYDRFNIAITQICCEVILEKYLYIDFNGLLNSGC